jgi:hypothetical protein
MAKKIYGGIDLQDQSVFKLFDADSSNFLGLKAPATISSDYTLTLPTTDGDANQALTTDGSGVLTWADYISTSLNDGLVLIGNGSNVATGVDTASVGDIDADSTAGLTIKAGVIVDADVNASAAITLSKLAATTASRALVSDGSGFVSPSSVTSTELGYVSGVTSSIQTQIDNVTSTIQNFEWQESVINKDLTAPPGSESAGDRYLIGVDTGASSATGLWATHDGEIAEWNGSSWVFTTPTVGMYVAADDESNSIYLFGGTTWAEKAFEQTTASTGLTKVGFDVRLDSSSAGDGLGFSAGVLAVNVDDSTIETNTDSLRLKDGGILNAKINASAGINFSKMEALTISRALVSDGSGNVSVSAVTSTEIGYLDGVTSALQTQLDAKAGTALDNLSVASLAAEDILVASSGSAVGRLAVGSNGQVLKVSAGSVVWADDSGSNTFKADWITADGVSKVVNHALGTSDVMVQIYDKANGETIEIDSVDRTDTNNVTVTASSAPNASGWRVLIIEI